MLNLQLTIQDCSITTPTSSGHVWSTCDRLSITQPSKNDHSMLELGTWDDLKVSLQVQSV